MRLTSYTIEGDIWYTDAALTQNQLSTPKQQVRLRGKLKKGERRKAAQAAMRAESVLHQESDRHHNDAASSQSLSVTSRGDGSDRHRVPAAANGARRRRKNPASHREFTSPRNGHPKRESASKVRRHPNCSQCSRYSVAEIRRVERTRHSKQPTVGS